MEIYELCPVDGRQSFYGKAKVFIDERGTKTLVSYNTPVIRREIDGTLTRLWSGWTATTGRHIRAFCGLDKSAWDALPVCCEG